MFENTVDLQGNDLIWRNKPDLPVANEENRKLEDSLKQKKIEIERLKVILESNINKGKSMREHFTSLGQTLSYKQQLYKSKEHEFEMEVHAHKLLERECSRLEQEIKAANQEISSLKRRQQMREMAITEQMNKREKLKAAVQLDEDALLHYLEKSAQMEKDNVALLKYSSEDDSRINELGLLVEKLSKQAYERKSALDEADTEVFIVQSELDRIQEEFRNAYHERNNLINNWEKVMNQIQQRTDEIQKLSDQIVRMRDEEAQLKRTQKEQLQLLSIENARNSELEQKINEKDKLVTKLRNDVKQALSQEEDLKAELATVRNVSSNLLYQKQMIENNLKQLEKQMDQKCEKLLEVKRINEKLENEIDSLTKETFEVDHYIKELENLLQAENIRNLKMQKDISNLSKDIMTFAQEIKELKAKEKFMDSEIKNCQAEIRNLNTKIGNLDRIRTRQESEMYEVESSLEKLQRRLKKMAGETNEEEKQKVDAQRAQLLSILEEKKISLNMLTEELKIMMEKLAVSTKDLEVSKKLNVELMKKIRSLEFYLSNSHKALKCCISRKQELLVQECMIKLQMKRYRKLLNCRNRTVSSLQRSKVEFEAIMKERTEELKNCNDLLDAEIRAEEDECSVVKRKLQECEDKTFKLQSKYKIIMDALGVPEPGESAEAEILIKAENEKRDLQYERDKLVAAVIKHEDELSALKNTLWMINAANEQFKHALNPPGISSEDNEALKNSEVESQKLAIQLHVHRTELKSLEDSIKTKKEELNQKQSYYDELQDILTDREAENVSINKEISDLDEKINRAARSNSRLTLDVKNKDTLDGFEEDVKIHLLREVRRTVSDLLFAAVESKPEISAKVQDLFQEVHIPLPSRARSSLSSRSSSVMSMHSRGSSKLSSPKTRRTSFNSSPVTSGRSSRTDYHSPSADSAPIVDEN